MLLLRDIDAAEIEEVRVGVVTVDFEDFGNESPSGPSFDVDDDVERITDVRLDGAVGQFHAALQYAARESGQALLGRTGMNRGQGAGVAGVEKLQEVERLAGPDFAQQNSVWPVPQGCFQEVADRNGWDADLFPASFKTNEIQLGKLYLRGVFYQEDAFIGWNELSERIEQGCLARSGPTANQQVSALQNVVLEAVCQGAGNGSALDQI